MSGPSKPFTLVPGVRNIHEMAMFQFSSESVAFSDRSVCKWCAASLDCGRWMRHRKYPMPSVAG
jgi:hypothetical protein